MVASFRYPMPDTVCPWTTEQDRNRLNHVNYSCRPVASPENVTELLAASN